MSKTLNTNMVTLGGVSVIDPSQNDWSLSDVSASDAGRDEATTMHKMTLSMKRQYDLAWNNIDYTDAATILQAVSYDKVGETFSGTLWDAMNCQYETRTYYVGDRKAPMQQWFDREDGKLYSKLSFTIIEV